MNPFMLNCGIRPTNVSLLVLEELFFLARATILEHNFGPHATLLKHLFGTNSTIDEALENIERETLRMSERTAKVNTTKRTSISLDYMPGGH